MKRTRSLLPVLGELHWQKALVGPLSHDANATADADAGESNWMQRCSHRQTTINVRTTGQRVAGFPQPATRTTSIASLMRLTAARRAHGCTHGRKQPKGMAPLLRLARKQKHLHTQHKLGIHRALRAQGEGGKPKGDTTEATRMTKGAGQVPVKSVRRCRSCGEHGLSRTLQLSHSVLQKVQLQPASVVLQQVRSVSGQSALKTSEYSSGGRMLTKEQVERDG